MLVISDEYRSDDYRLKEYNYYHGVPLELSIPVGDRILSPSKYVISITLVQAVSYTPILDNFVIEPSICEIPAGIINELRGVVNCQISIRNDVTNSEKVIRTVLYER